MLKVVEGWCHKIRYEACSCLGVFCWWTHRVYHTTAAAHGRVLFDTVLGDFLYCDVLVDVDV